jgi:hypothetical protein
MPKKRRPARTTRRAPRRPEFAPGPNQARAQPAERTDLDGNPIFADEVANAEASAAYTGPGPVETRPEWIGSASQETARRKPGRRTAQLRQRGTSEGAARIAAGQLPTFEHAYIADELRRIVTISGVLFTLVIVLAIVMR